jgi:hypothetical protein
MNVEIGTEAAQFPEKEYINGIFLAVPVTVCCTVPWSAVLYSLPYQYPQSYFDNLTSKFQFPEQLVVLAFPSNQVNSRLIFLFR